MSKKVFFIGVLVLILIAVFVVPRVIAPNVIGANYRNVTVTTSVNITNSRPEILNVSVYESTNSSLINVTINAGGFKNVTCNATLRDWNGFNDIIYVNATLYHSTNSTSNASDNNNTHYTNSNCTNSGNGAGLFVNYLCEFSVIYYANNGTWNCNITAQDTLLTNGTGYNSTVFYPVYALNVTDGIDFGNAAVEDFTGNTTANITNLGNMVINITVEGYGARRNDRLAMNCSLGGNITVANERYALADVDWNSMTALNGTTQPLHNLTMPKQINSSLVVNATYWRLYVDSTNSPGGNCTGNIIFTAVAP